MNSLQCNHTTHRIRLQDLFVTTFEKLAGVCAGGYPFLSLSYSFLSFPLFQNRLHFGKKQPHFPQTRLRY